MKSENIILFIAAFAALSALLSAGFTYYSASSFKEGIITGLASQTNGTVNITVNTLLSINFTNTTSSFKFSSRKVMSYLMTSGINFCVVFIDFK